MRHFRPTALSVGHVGCSQGPGASSARSGRIPDPVRAIVRRSRIRSRKRRDRPTRDHRVARVRGGPQGAGDARGRPGLCRSRLRAVGRVARHARSHRRRAGAPARSGRTVARAGHLRRARATTARCPGEMSKTFRLATCAREVFAQAAIATDVLDLSLLTSDYGAHIHPCKGCVSTAMPLCHWPCSCYPNHALGQTNDWMAEIYERWTAAHGVMIVTPVLLVPGAERAEADDRPAGLRRRRQPRSDVDAGKKPAKAKALELEGWAYPQASRRARVWRRRARRRRRHRRHCGARCRDWLDWMGLIDAGANARLDRYIGYYEPYATSHEALDRDTGLQEEVRNVARALVTPSESCVPAGCRIQAANCARRGRNSPFGDTVRRRCARRTSRSPACATS